MFFSFGQRVLPLENSGYQNTAGVVRKIFLAESSASRKFWVPKCYGRGKIFPARNSCHASRKFSGHSGVNKNFFLLGLKFLECLSFSKIFFFYYPPNHFVYLLCCPRSGYQMSLMVFALTILVPAGLELPILGLLGWCLIHSTTKFLLRE